MICGAVSKTARSNMYKQSTHRSFGLDILQMTQAVWRTGQNSCPDTLISWSSLLTVSDDKLDM